MQYLRFWKKKHWEIQKKLLSLEMFCLNTLDHLQMVPITQRMTDNIVLTILYLSNNGTITIWKNLVHYMVSSFWILLLCMQTGGTYTTQKIRIAHTLAQHKKLLSLKWLYSTSCLNNRRRVNTNTENSLQNHTGNNYNWVIHTYVCGHSCQNCWGKLLRKTEIIVQSSSCIFHPNLICKQLTSPIWAAFNRHIILKSE